MDKGKGRKKKVTTIFLHPSPPPFEHKLILTKWMRVRKKWWGRVCGRRCGVAQTLDPLWTNENLLSSQSFQRKSRESCQEWLQPKKIQHQTKGTPYGADFFFIL